VNGRRIAHVLIRCLCVETVSLPVEARLLGGSLVDLGRGLKVIVAAHVRVLARQEAPLVWAQVVKAPAVEVCDVLVIVDSVPESVALYLDEEHEVRASGDDPANDALEVYVGIEFLVVDLDYFDDAADCVEAVFGVFPAQGGLGLGLGGPECLGLGLEGEGLGLVLWRGLVGVGGREWLVLDEVPEGGVVHADAGVVGVGVGDLGLVADGDDVRGQELGLWRVCEMCV